MADSRPRNPEGQFSPEAGDGIGSGTMQAAYNPAIIQQRKQVEQSQVSPVMDRIRRKGNVARGVETTVPNSSPGSSTMMGNDFLRLLVELSAKCEAKEFAKAYDGIEAGTLGNDVMVRLKKGEGVAAHLKRNAGKYIGAGAGAVLGAPVGNPIAPALVGTAIGELADAIHHHSALKRALSNQS